MKDKFEFVVRPHGDCWKHKDKAYWIVFYSSIKESGKPCYYTYKATENKKGRDPWTLSNIRTGEYKSLEEAMESII